VIALAANLLRQCLRGGGLAADGRSALRAVQCRPFLALLLLVWTAPISAQAYQCRMPQTISVPTITPDGTRRATPVTGYTLALSWSPEFCKGREDSRSDAHQCSGRNGRFGLAVHGLWPEGRGGWPQWCERPAGLTPAEARRNLCMMPSAELLARQWAKHGSCMARNPETYFKVTRILWGALRIPDYDRLSRQKALTVGDIRGALADANPWIAPEDIGVELNERGWFEELRICYGKDFRPRACNARRKGAGDDAPAKIWRGL